MSLGWGDRLGLSALGLLFGLGLSEAAVRALNPAPRLQLIDRAKDFDTRVVDGTLVWSYREAGELLRHNIACDRPVRVVWLGCSVDYGVEVAYEDTFVGRLDAALAADGVCIHNLARPGFLTPQNEVELVDWVAANGEPDLVVFDVWSAYPARYRPISPTVWAQLPLRLPVDTDTPLPPPLPLPAGFHRGLLARSLLWQRLTLAVVPESPPRVDYVQEVHRSVEALSAGGQRPLLVWLHRVVGGNESADFARLAWHERPYPAFDLASRMDGLDPTPLFRSDVHFNEQGHVWAFEQLLPAVRDRLVELGKIPAPPGWTPPAWRVGRATPGAGLGDDGWP